MSKAQPTHLIRLDKAGDAQLDWTIGYEGLKFNCYKLGSEWIYHDENALWFIQAEDATVCGEAHDAHFYDNTLYCNTCEARLSIWAAETPRQLQNLLHEFILVHGAPVNWQFENWVLRRERRYHNSDYAKIHEFDTSNTGLTVTATKLPEGGIVITDNEGGKYVRQ